MRASNSARGFKPTFNALQQGCRLALLKILLSHLGLSTTPAALHWWNPYKSSLKLRVFAQFEI